MVIGSKAVTSKEEVKSWIEAFGANRFVIALDVNRDGETWRPATHGWLESQTIYSNLLSLHIIRCGRFSMHRHQ